MSDQFIKGVARKFDNEFLVVDDDSNSKVDVIPTGSLALDMSTGIGGIPKGRFTMIYGAESAGKTTICLEIVRNAVLMGQRVLYIDAEQSLDYNYVRAVIGQDFDVTKLTIIQPETAEEAMGIAEMGINGDDKLKIPAGSFDLIIVDSIAALSPEKEKEKDLDSPTVALISKLLTVWFRRNAFAVRTQNIAFVFVNQVRDKIGSYVGGYTFPGGHALKHYASLIIFLSKGTEIKAGDKSIGILSSFVVKKNKLGSPFRSYEIPILFGTGIDRYRDILEFAELLGVIRKNGSYLYFGEEMLGQGIVKSADYLINHPETLDKLKESCYNTLSLK